jgi:DNA repair exonuclease SbcCD ATPase subunit
MLQRGGWLNDPSGVSQRAVDQARRKLEAEARWAEEQLREIRRRAAERARSQLEQGGDEENKLADRARELAQKARTSGTFPQQAIESIEDAELAAREAAAALRHDDAEQGVARQREAQRDLEAAREQLRGDDDESAHAAREDGDGRTSSGATDIVPKAGTHHGPEEFRRRVMRGLGQPASGTLKDAVKRYAEGLLR